MNVVPFYLLKLKNFNHLREQKYAKPSFLRFGSILIIIIFFYFVFPKEKKKVCLKLIFKIVFCSPKKTIFYFLFLKVKNKMFSKNIF